MRCPCPAVTCRRSAISGVSCRIWNARGALVRIREPVSVVHDMTEIHRRTLRANGPALLFEAPIMPDGAPGNMPVLVNLFGTTERTAWGFRRRTGAARLARRRRWRSFGSQRPPRDFRGRMSKVPLRALR